MRNAGQPSQAPRLADQLDRVISSFKAGHPIADILTFSEDPRYLGRKLYPAQREILGEFFNGPRPYEELLLICGRDSTKTFTASIIASYIAYLWLEIPDPYYLYSGRVDREKEVHIICVARKEAQATILLDEIKAKINSSPYFAGKIRSQNNYEVVIEKNLHIQAVTSNSASEVGKTAILVLFDEIGKYGEEVGTRDGEEVYDSLTPSVGRFASNRPEFLKRCAGDPGLEMIVRALGRVVSISTPMGKSGILWRLFGTAQRLPSILHYQRPTWEMNPNYPPGCAYLETQKAKNPRTFLREYGAKFDEAIDAMLPPELVDQCSGPTPPYDHQIVYHGAIDTSRKKDAFCFAIGHIQGGKVFIDLIRYWIPKDGRLEWSQVQYEIKRACRAFQVEDLLHDGYEGEAVKLYFNEFLLHETPFTQPYKMKIYGALEDRLFQRQIQYPPDERLLRELKALQKKWNGENFSVHHPDTGPIQNDDGPDVIANLAFHLFSTFVATREGIDDDRVQAGGEYWPLDPRDVETTALIGGGGSH